MDIHFHSYKVRYDILDKFFKPVRTSTPVSMINIFINLDDFFHLLHHPLVNNEFQVIGQNAAKQMVSNVLNLMGHYRNWAIRRQNCKVRIFGIYTSYIRAFKNQLYLPNYRKKFKEDNDSMNTTYYFVNQTIHDSIKIFGVIGEYIPDVYLIDSEYLEPSMIPCYIAEYTEYKADWNLLVTRDSYDLQYAYRDRWMVISPKGDNSMILNRGNIWNYLNIRENIYKEEIDIQYRSELFPLALSIVGNKYRSIPRLRRIGWKTLFKYLDTIKEEFEGIGIITVTDKFIEMVKNKKSISDDDYYSNLHCIDVEMQSKMLLEVDKTTILSQIVDRYDYDSLEKLNREIFIQFPIRLEFLCRESKKTPFD